MKQLSSHLQQLLVEYAHHFPSLRGESYPGNEKLLQDYETLKEGEGDSLFNIFGVGNSIAVVHSPFERAQSYELLLRILKEYDKEQYLKIHKGTPYYFIGWVAYEYLDFAKAFFYIDAAASEDLKFTNVANQSTTRPSLDFFLLKNKVIGTGFTINVHLIRTVADTLNSFNKEAGLSLAKDNFVEKFVRPLLYGGKKKRSLLNALYIFILESEKRKLEIDLRSSTGGSIEPFISHLFDGARLLESLLQLGGGTGNALRSKIVSLPQLEINSTSLFSNQPLSNAEIKMFELRTTGINFQNCNFCASYIIRNTTGHSLIWEDEFKSINAYNTLYKCLINSIFWSIYKLWCV